MALLLIADDLSISRETLARVLREAGHRVLTASSGEEALERARSEPPDMALLDFNMQGMNGLQTAAGLKAQSTAPLLPVMIISGKVLGANELTEILATAVLAVPQLTSGGGFARCEGPQRKPRLSRSRRVRPAVVRMVATGKGRSLTWGWFSSEIRGVDNSSRRRRPDPRGAARA